MSPVSTSAVFGRRACAVLAVCSAVLHGAMVGHGVAAAVTLVMAVACLYCAYELWTRTTLKAWTSVAVMNLVMIGAHLSMPGHHHGGGAVPQLAAPSTLMTTATSLAVVEALIATVVLYRLSRDSHRVISARFSGLTPE
jgi:hypothetical protein